MSIKPPRIDTWRLVVRGNVPTQNKVRRMHHYAEAAVKAEWVGLFMALIRAAKVPKGLDHIEVHATQLWSRGEPDTDAAAPAIKCAIDALVRCGVVQDDKAKWVSPIVLWPPKKAKTSGLEIVIYQRNTPRPPVPKLSTDKGVIAWGMTKAT